MERPEPPPDGAGPLERTDEVTFGSALRQELRSLAFARQVLANQPSATGVLARLRDARLHMIGAEEEFRMLKCGSRQDPSWSLLQRMRALGHQSAQRWLSAYLGSVGRTGTVDLNQFAGRPIALTPET